MPTTYSFTYPFFIFALSFFLCTCGGNDKITVAGQVTYTFIPVDKNGLNYTKTEERPIRGAVVQLLVGNTVFATSNTTDQGQYHLQAPQDSSVTVVVSAELGPADTPDTKIISNTDGDALYQLVTTAEVKTENIFSLNFNATTKFDDFLQRYSQREGAPFAILDTIYTAQQKIREVDANVVFPPLIINWSPENTSTDNSVDLSTGNIGTSFYLRSNFQDSLYILGDESTDTDEYDQHVIAHEWAHYFEENFSRSDSIGGPHSGGDILDATVAFSEGFANAWAAILLDNPIYIDTFSLSAIEFNIEQDTIPDTARSEFGNVLIDGYYSEVSIQEILYDLFDTGNPNETETTQIPFALLYKTLTGPQKDTTAFTTMFSFLSSLNPLLSNNQRNQVVAISRAENINSNTDAFGGINDSNIVNLYTTINTDTTALTAENIETFGDINKLHNRRFFRLFVSTTRCYNIDILNPNPTNKNIGIYLPGTVSLQSSPQTIKLDVGSHAFAIGSIGANNAVSYTLQISSATAC